MEDQGQYAKLFNEMDSQALITLGLILVSTILLIIVWQIYNSYKLLKR